MPITKNGDTIVFTPTEEAQLKMQQFEKEAIANNYVVNQYGGSTMISAESNNKERRQPDKLGVLKIHRLMRMIASGGNDSMLASRITPSTPAPEVQAHSASSNVAATNNTAIASSDDVLKTFRLMKKIVNGPGF